MGSIVLFWSLQTLHTYGIHNMHTGTTTVTHEIMMKRSFKNESRKIDMKVKEVRFNCMSGRPAEGSGHKCGKQVESGAGTVLDRGPLGSHTQHPHALKITCFADSPVALRISLRNTNSHVLSSSTGNSKGIPGDRGLLWEGLRLTEYTSRMIKTLSLYLRHL